MLWHACECVLFTAQERGAPQLLAATRVAPIVAAQSADLSDTLIRCKIADLANTLTVHKHD